MASNYPTGLDSYAVINPTDPRNAPSLSGRLNDIGDAIEAIENELGTDPSGASATVKARLEALEAGTPLTAAEIAYAGSTNLSSTNVEAALDELDAEKAAAAAATAAGTSYAGGTGMSASNVEAAIDELADEKQDKLRPVHSYTSAQTLTTANHIVLCSGTFTVTLPTAVGNGGLMYYIKNTGTGTITVDGNGAQTIDDATTFVLDAQYEAITIVSDGAEWWVV